MNAISSTSSDRPDGPRRVPVSIGRVHTVDRLVVRGTDVGQNAGVVSRRTRSRADESTFTRAVTAPRGRGGPTVPIVATQQWRRPRGGDRGPDPAAPLEYF